MKRPGFVAGVVVGAAATFAWAFSQPPPDPIPCMCDVCMSKLEYERRQAT